MFSFDAEELRAIIKGKAIWRKCPDCGGLGIIYYAWDTIEELHSHDIDVENYDPDNELHGCQSCDNCDELGYLLVEIDLD